MRPLEIVIPCVLAIYILWPVLTGKSRPKTINGLSLLALVLTGFHLVMEKYRWQMIPMYVLVLICTATGILGLVKNKVVAVKKLSWTTAGLVFSTIILLFSTAIPYLLPVPVVPIPSGPYQIGTTTLVLTDTSRKEIYSTNPDEPRKIIVQIWYPAVPTPDSQRASWMPNADIVAPALADMLKLPHFFLDHLTLVKTNSYIDAPADHDGGPFPVLLFSHGWKGFRAQNTGQFEELAARGYIIASIEHPYAAVVTVFPDGKIIHYNPNALPDNDSDEEYTAAAHLLLEQWTSDTIFTLDTLTQLNQNDPSGILTGLLDLDHVGAFGHSTGGGSTIQFCVEDLRCKAVLGMDAWMKPVSTQALDTGSDLPMLFLFSETFPTEENWQLFDQLALHLSGQVSVATINGTSHYDFSDLPSLTPLAPMLHLKGPLRGQRVIEIINDFSLTFFDQTLKGIPATFFSGPSSAYPELEFRQSH